MILFSDCSATSAALVLNLGHTRSSSSNLTQQHTGRSSWGLCLSAPYRHIDIVHIDIVHIDIVHIDIVHIDIVHIDIVHIDIVHIDIVHIYIYIYIQL